MAGQNKKDEKLPENMSLDAGQQKEFSDKVKGFKKKSGKGERKAACLPGVVYLGHIPHGFFERQMKAYFTQFGTVKRLRIARSKKTGKMKGYAFVEFENCEVAKIVADTMNNYLMFHRLLKCQYLPLEKVHPKTFKGSGRMFRKPKSHLLAIERHNSTKTTKQRETSLKKTRARSTRNAAKLAALGLKYDFPDSVVSTEAIPAETSPAETKEDSSLSDLQKEAIALFNEDSCTDEEDRSPGKVKRRKTAKSDKSQSKTPPVEVKSEADTSDNESSPAKQQTSPKKDLKKDKKRKSVDGNVKKRKRQISH